MKERAQRRRCARTIVEVASSFTLDAEDRACTFANDAVVVGPQSAQRSFTTSNDHQASVMGLSCVADNWPIFPAPTHGTPVVPAIACIPARRSVAAATRSARKSVSR